jgi:hypothetical protein
MNAQRGSWKFISQNPLSPNLNPILFTIQKKERLVGFLFASFEDNYCACCYYDDDCYCNSDVAG